MSNTLNKNFYHLSPVEVVKVTSQNLEEVAEWCGGRVAEAASRRVEGRMDKYVWVPTPKGNNGISWAFPGMFITKRLVRTVKDEIKTTYAVFRRDYFDKNYFETPEKAIEQTWERGQKRKPKPEPKNVTVNVMGSEVLSFEQAKEVLEAAAPGSKVTVNQVPPIEQPPTTHEQAIANLEAGGITGEIIEDRPSTPDEQRELLREEAVEAEAKEVHEPGAGEVTQQGEAAAPSIRTDALTDDILTILGLPTSESDNYGVVTWGSLTAEQLSVLENATK